MVKLLPEEQARHLRRDERRYTEALRALHSIARVLAEPGSFVDQVTAVLEEVKTVLAVDSADLRMPDAEEAGLRVVASVGSAQQLPGTFRAYGDSRTGRTFQQGEPIIAHDYEVNHRGGPDRGRRTRSGYEAKSVAWLPVKAAGRTVGVLAVDTAKRNYFTAERVQLLTTIADEIGVFIENAHLRETERNHVQELEVLNRAATIFAGGGTFREKAKSVLDAIVALSGDWASLRVPDESGKHLSLVATTRPGTNDVVDVGTSQAGEAMTLRKPVVVNAFVRDPRSPQAAIDQGVRSRAAIPVIVNGSPQAVLGVSSRLPHYFTPERVALLMTIAAGIGPSLERARLEEEANERERHLSKALLELQVTQQQLIQSGKLAAIGELVAGVAHEINNPLGGILGHTELLLRADVQTDREGSLQAIRDATERISRIVQNLLSFARERKPQKELRSLRDALIPMLELRRGDLRKEKIEVIVEVAPNLPAVMVDLQQFEQVFLNIINNAHQAMATAHGRGRLEIRGWRVNRAVRFTFVDDGPGMSANTLEHAFDPFYTTKEIGQGTGLGLSICFGIIAEHGGRIWATSPKGKGTTIGVEVPIP